MLSINLINNISLDVIGLNVRLALELASTR